MSERPYHKTDDLHETNRYRDAAFPVGLYTVTRGRILPAGRGYQDLHWHEELQITRVEHGILHIRVSDVDYMLNEGEAIFINSNLLHVTTELSERGKYCSVNFPPRLLTFFPESRMETSYVKPYIQYSSFPVCIFRPTGPDWQRKTLKKIDAVITLLGADFRRFDEYRISVLLTEIWLEMISNVNPKAVTPSPQDVKRQMRIQQMLTYIQQHYDEDIHLSDIAASANVSAGECCRCFQACIRQSPTQYLLSYRITKSVELLIYSDLPIAVIAGRTGFNDPSHFTQYFKRKTGITPNEYRKKHAARNP
jgi:AraC-like DNA-binding protein